MLRSTATPDRTSRATEPEMKQPNNPTPLTAAQGTGRWSYRSAQPDENQPQTLAGFACLGTNHKPWWLVESIE